MESDWSGEPRRARTPTKVSTFSAALALVFSVLVALPAQAQRPAQAEGSALSPDIVHSLRNDTSAPLRSIDPAEVRPAISTARELPMFQLPGAAEGGGAATGEGSRALDTAQPAGLMLEFDNDFEGVGNVDGVLPPDTNGDVGPNHYMQWVNLSFAIWDKDGNLLVGPLPGNSLFDGFGGVCETHNDGDPVVLYDHLSDRWFATQFALFAADGHHQCIAVSETGDPTGAWHRYDFLISADKINDYGKFGVWPDAYYMAVNQFDEDTFAWAGQGVAAFERDQMLQGLPARMVFFDLFDVDPAFGGQLPSDLDGFPPPLGTPNTFIEADDDAFGFDTDRLSVWEFHVDWAAPENSTFGLDGLPNHHLDTAPFEMELCGFARSCIPQPDTPQGLDAISDRLMFRLQYRTFGDHSTLVVNHTVDADGTDHAGVRWYELRDTGSGWTIHQQGTYAPDADHRWMGSAAMDASGNIAVGYSVSSEETFPSIRVAGRLASDPLGELSQGETEMIAGTGSQTHSAARWGDYSMMAVDPVDQCTFWFTSEYLSTTSLADWQTRIGHFTFPSCTLGPSGTLTGTVTDAVTGDPIEGATVTANQVSTRTGADGTYSFTLPVGTYDMTATAYGYETVSVTGVEVLEDETTTQDFALNPVPAVTVGGTVTDGPGHGWPLYARIDIDGYPGGPVFTDPVTGQYSVELVQQTDFTFHVTAVSGGHLEETRDLTFASDTATEDFVLEVDPATCDAPGYTTTVDGLFETFDSQETPAGWTVVDNLGNGQVWRFDDPGGRGNLTGGSGGFAVVDSDFYGPDGSQDTELVTPVIDLSAVADPSITFSTDYLDFEPTPEIADVDLSIDGGATWENVWRQTTTLPGPTVVEIPIPQAANDADVQVRFHYYDAAFSWWWLVDNVTVGGQPECSPIPGGLVVGNVYDEITGDAIDGATVTSGEAPQDSATTGPTPEDENLDDGFYLLFSSLTGEHPFTASKANYAPSTVTVNVVADGVVRQDFQLSSGALTVAPDSLEVTVGLGETTTATLTVTNEGSADATFEIHERDLGSDVLEQEGARIRRVSGTYPSGSAVDTPHSRSDVERPIPGPNDPPWLDIADHPFGVMDSIAGTFDGLVYSVTGIDEGLAWRDELHSYDPATDTWTELSPIGTPRERPNGAIIDGRFYVVGGWDASGITVPELEIYDIASDTWSTGAPIPEAWAASSNVTLDGLLYLIGGCQDACGSTDVWVYDPAGDAWTQAADYPEPISWAHCGALDGLIYCAGGTGGSTTTANAYVYDPAADSWSSIAAMPQDQWAGGYVAANGQLLVSGGVTDGFATLTNEGFAYDPASDTWTPIPNSNNVLYRGASACGFYKIGGSVGGFSPVPDSEVLPGLEDCGAAADVPWLGEDPVTATVPAGGSVEVTVTFDASVPEVDQPGAYMAELLFSEDTPHVVPPVPVTMNVTPPAGWGKIEGTVIGLERCDEPGGPLAGATVHIDGAIEDFDLVTDADGFYEWWLDAANSPLSITVSHEGSVSETRDGVAITAGNITTEDFTLRLDAPCADVTPESIDVTVAQGETLTTDLTLTNEPAAAPYDFEIDETPFILPPSAPEDGEGADAEFSEPAEIGPQSVRSEAGGGARPDVPSPAVPGWFGANDLPGGLVRYAHAQCDGDTDHLYVFGGVDGTFTVSDRSWVYSAGANTWTELAPMPAGSEGPTAACEGGKIHVLGGDGTDQHYVYDIGSDTWSDGAALPRPVWGAAAGSFAGSIYLIGGDADFFSGGTSDEVNVYDIASDSWTGTGAPMPTAAVAAGFAQSATHVYVVGGWGDDAPVTNLDATQRYDMLTDAWETGPAFTGIRSDLALAATNAALYAIGGDEDGGAFFDASASADRLALDAWPGGSWSSVEALPIAISANSGGFCTDTGVFAGEVWSVGGGDLLSFGITGRTFFRDIGDEGCPSIRADVPWLSVDPTSGTVEADSSLVVEVTIDATDLEAGEYGATLLISTTDPARPEMRVPVHVTVTEGGGGEVAAYLAVEQAGSVGDVAVESNDVVAVNDDGTVELFFDGGDVGLDGMAIDAFATDADGSLLFSFAEPGTVPDIADQVDDSDLVRFVPTSTGEDTAGTFELYFDGSDVGLTSTGEDVDAVDVLPEGIAVSARGKANVPGVGAADASDLLQFVPTSTGGDTAGTWSLSFDGSDVELNSANENVDAVAVNGDASLVALSTSGPLSVTGLTAADEDVASFLPTQLGSDTQGSFDPVLLIDGTTLGIEGNDVTAVELG